GPRARPRAQPRRWRARPRAAADRGADRGPRDHPRPRPEGQSRRDVLRPGDRGGVTDAAAGPNGSPGTTRVSIASGPLVGPGLRRGVGMLTARRELPTGPREH